jgi:lipopolysaccharide export system protein LptA
MRSLAFLYLLFVPFLVLSQQKTQTQTIKIDHATTLFHDNKVAGGAQRLIGNVQIEDDAVIMNCDSAYVYSDNSFIAYHNVHLTKKDTTDLYGDSLHYNGNTKEAQMFGQITFKHKKMTLTTQHLIYNVDSSYAHYWDGGKLIDTSNTLTSRMGTYNSESRIASFKDNVVLVNPDYTIKCDTMAYSPTNQVSYFYGPTHITSKSNYMYCERGYYNSKTGISQFWQHPYMNGKKGEKLNGDQIFYDKKKDYGQILDNSTLIDTTDNIVVKGDYAYYNGNDKTILVTCKALMEQEYDKDTLFLHSDTLFGYNVSMNDTNMKAQNPPKLLLAYHHVRFFKKDMQGRCDSLSYDEKDSVMHMLYSPILWSDENQLTSDTMHLHLKNKHMDKMDMRNNAFIASKDTLATKLDTLRFNQIKGRNMKAYFMDNKVHRVDVKGNAQTIYYVYTDNNTKVIGANRADCSNMTVFIENNKIKSITFLDKPDATLFPMQEVKPQEFLLKNFSWHENLRPHTKLEIFKDTP